jgi:hypothetical protein
VIKDIEKKSVLVVFGRFFGKKFSTRFCSVFELTSLRNTRKRKRDKTKEVEEKLTSKFLSIFSGKCFRHGLFAKKLLCFCGCGVFELPSPRNAQKLIQKKCQCQETRGKKYEVSFVG